MPEIGEIRINAIQRDLGPIIAVSVSAQIRLSTVEKSLGMNYQTRIVLYEIDDQLDVFSVFPNGSSIFVQHAKRGTEDDFLSFSPVKSFNADRSEVTIDHQFVVTPTIERDIAYEFRALVVCVPDTATAMKWSSTERITAPHFS